jgi:hypothetical protein
MSKTTKKAVKKIKPKLKRVTVVFQGTPGDAKDEAAQRIFDKHAGPNGLLNAGTFLGKKPERDIEYEMPANKATACVKELKKAGFKRVFEAA